MRHLHVALAVVLCVTTNNWALADTVGTTPQLPSPTSTPTTATPTPSVASPTATPTPTPTTATPPTSLPSEASSPSYWWDYLSRISSGVAALCAIAALYVSQKNTKRMADAALSAAQEAMWQKANETELREIQTKLDTFFSPFFVLLKTDHQFAQDLRERQHDDTHRLLIKLFDLSWLKSLSPGDKALVNIICENAELLDRFLTDHSGIVDAQILPYLARARAHFRILHLAYKHQLGDNPTRFVDYVYPTQLDYVLSLEVERLRKRIEQLRTNPGTRPGPLAALQIPKSHQLPDWADPDGRLAGVPTAEA